MKRPVMSVENANWVDNGDGSLSLSVHDAQAIAALTSMQTQLSTIIDRLTAIEVAVEGTLDVTIV